MKRIYSIDFARGVVMMIMPLDHVRDLMHIASVTQSPTNLATTTPILFFTRWITHLCAPIFVFLAGTSAFLAFNNKQDISQSRKFLLKRGLWLILLDFTVVNLGLFFDPCFHTLIFEVIAAVGFGFLMLALLIKLPSKTIGLIGLAIIFLHDLVFLIPMGQNNTFITVFSQFFVPSASPVFSNRIFIMGYPPIPWVGIIFAGFGAGSLFNLPQEQRKSLFLKIAAGALLLFIIVRFINVYGDPVPWSAQKTPMYTFLSYMNVAKYPPSLSFCSAMLGIMFLILALGEHIRTRTTDIAYTYGKVPLFYFIVHFYLIHFLLIVILFAQGFHWADMNFVSGSFGRPKAASGIPLWAVYLVWIGIVVLLYKPCVWFGKYKAEHKYWWLKYI